MTDATNKKLIEFISHVENLAQGVIHMTGVNDCAKLIQCAEELKTLLGQEAE